MSYSTQRVTSDGTLILLPISIEYFDRTEISVLFNGVVTSDWAWVGSTDKTLSFTPAVPNGTEVTVLRTTDLSEVRHMFSLGAAFKAETVDEDFSQILHIAQEAREIAGISDVYQDIDIHGYKIRHLGLASEAGDAVSFGQFSEHDATIVGYKDAAAASAAAAAISAEGAAASAAAAEAAGTVAAEAAIAASIGVTVQAYSPDATQAEMEAGVVTSRRSVSPLRIAQAIAARTTSQVLWGYLAGCTMATAGNSTSLSVAAGQAADSTNTVMLRLTGGSTKTTAAWVVGSGVGGLDTGVIAASTWYHWYLIRRPDTGAVDVIFSLSPTAPALPMGYTMFRRIGAAKTTAASQWRQFFQDGDLFQWETPSADVAATNPGTDAVLRSLAVPSGLPVQALVQLIYANSSSGGSGYAYLSDPATVDVAASATNTDTPLVASVATAVVTSGSQRMVRTNTNAQIRSRVSYSDGAVSLRLNTIGWVDSRGRNA